MANVEAMGLSSPAPFLLHWQPIIAHHITQGDELRLYAAAVLGLGLDECREIALDGQFAASPGL